MIKNYKLIGLFLVILISSTLIACGDNKSNANISNKKIDKEITAKEVIKENNIDTLDIVNKLCSNEIQNRYFEEEGNRLAVEYINNLFSELKLEYVFETSYLHEFILENKGYKTDGKMISEEVPLNNIVGKISGKNNKTAIIITAHIDSFGKGVLDNASGVSVTLKIADILKNSLKDNLPNYDIIFCITNAEMQGFIGSEKFVNDIKDKYEKLYNANIDCIGLKTGGPLALKNISNINESEKLYKSLKEKLKESNIEFSDVVSSEKVNKAIEVNYGVSDYFSFEKLGIPNIHISQSNIAPLPEKQDDGVETLDYENLNKLSEGIASWISEIKLD
ncbi:M28 family metallopeptidase [Clostridium senegalense]|uniref:Zn-dependent exopeptidase M28 n=1 Tax=Clostridium senegalense TaxID=1465809 RepID=A0A6M0H3V2_9CLOT|nr:M28 family peptidase [Clostridium senegalense]NEU04302.1 Zn-dependent exopeptidase M28 [Clostridium senegalense]